MRKSKGCRAILDRIGVDPFDPCGHFIKIADLSDTDVELEPEADYLTIDLDLADPHNLDRLGQEAEARSMAKAWKDSGKSSDMQPGMPRYYQKPRYLHWNGRANVCQRRAHGVNGPGMIDDYTGGDVYYGI